MRQATFKYFKFYGCLCMLFFICHSGFSQLDSIMKVIDKQDNTNQKTTLLLQSATQYSNSPLGLSLAVKAYEYAGQTVNDELLSNASFQLANEYSSISRFDSAMYYDDVVIDIQEKHNANKQLLFDALLLKSALFLSLNKTTEAFELNKKLIEMAEKLKNTDDLASVYSKMGALFKKVNDIEKSNSYFNKALKIYTQTKKWNGIESCYLNLGVNNSIKLFNDMAVEYFERGLEINKRTGDNHRKSLLLNGMAGVYYNLSNFEKALTFYKEALVYSRKTEDENLSANLNNNIGTVLMEMNRFAEAKPYLIEVYFASRNQKDKTELALFSSFNLAQLYEDLGEYKSAMDYMNIYVNMNDSLNNIANTRNLSEIEAKYQNEKKEEQNILLNERLKNKSMQIYFALGGIAFLMVLAFLIFRGLKEKQKANVALEEKNKIIEEKSLIVEEQHKDITDSIKYAERIQAAILPPEKLWKSILPNSFVFYQPKDILSGDFYWIENSEDFVFIAAADCTGHGVPGALMSIVNYNHLNKAILEKGLTDAGSILDVINDWLTQSLHQSYQESPVRDGMDISLCVIDKRTNRLNFAGAYNSIYILRDNKIEEITPDKQPVGAFIEDNIKPFHNKYVQLNKNDVVYMFTDGYADQFGGEKGKKYKYKQLQALLLEVHAMPFDTQKDLVSTSINDWKGKLEQIDDMLLLGFKWM